MAEIKSDWSAFPKLGRAVAAARAAFPAQRVKVMSQGIALLQRNIKEKILNPGSPFGPLVASKAGGLATSWNNVVATDGSYAATSSSKIHSSVMDQGRRPGARRPPTDAIEQWIIDKRIAERGLQAARSVGRLARSSGNRRPRGRKAGRAPTAKQKARFVKGLAFVIARSIARKGIRGRHYVQQAIEKSLPHLSQIFAGAADFVVRRMVQP